MTKTITNFEAEDREFLNFLKSLIKIIRTVEGQNNFENRILVLACYWRSKALEQLEYKLEQIIWMLKPKGKNVKKINKTAFVCH